MLHVLTVADGTSAMLSMSAVLSSACCGACRAYVTTVYKDLTSIHAQFKRFKIAQDQLIGRHSIAPVLYLAGPAEPA